MDPEVGADPGLRCSHFDALEHVARGLELFLKPVDFLLRLAQLLSHLVGTVTPKREDVDLAFGNGRLRLRDAGSELTAVAGDVLLLSLELQKARLALEPLVEELAHAVQFLVNDRKLLLRSSI